MACVFPASIFTTCLRKANGKESTRVGCATYRLVRATSTLCSPGIREKVYVRSKGVVSFSREKSEPSSQDVATRTEWSVMTARYANRLSYPEPAIGRRSLQFSRRPRSCHRHKGGNPQAKPYGSRP